MQRNITFPLIRCYVLTNNCGGQQVITETGQHSSKICGHINLHKPAFAYYYWV